MKFIVPDTIQQISPALASKLSLGSRIYPIGTLYQVKSTGLYFRLLATGGRWGREYAVTTTDGFVSRKFGCTHKFFGSEACTFDHKIDAVNALLAM